MIKRPMIGRVVKCAALRETPSETSTERAPAAKEMTPRKKEVAMSAYVSLLIIGIWFSAPWFLKYCEARRTEAWPHVAGRIIESKIVRGVFNSSWYTREEERYSVRYAYTVNGSPLQSETVSVVGFDRPANIVWKYPAGSAVEVFYDPKNPKSSVLEQGGVPHLWDLIVGLPVLLTGLAFFSLVEMIRLISARRQGLDGFNQVP